MRYSDLKLIPDARGSGPRSPKNEFRGLTYSVCGKPGVHQMRLTTRRGGCWVFRWESAKNNFNREGVTLSSIDDEINVALYFWERNAYRQACRHNPSLFRSSASELGRGPHPSIRENDDALAEFMGAHPIALLENAVCQRAFARWSHAKWFGSKAEVREHARILIDKCRKPRRGRPPKVRLFAPQLQQAYVDLMLYISSWYECIRVSRSPGNTLRLFPDCVRLEPAATSVPIPKISGHLTFAEILQRASVRPSASDVAEEYISRYLGLGKTQLHEYIKAAAVQSPRAD